MTSDDLDRTPIEHDPTGVRDLLAALPDPGPMPDAVTARILAALEQARATQVTDGSGHVIPLADAAIAREARLLEQTRHDRSLRVGRWLMAAAAVGIIAMGANALVTDRYGSWSAALGGHGFQSTSAAVGHSEAAGSAQAGGAMATSVERYEAKDAAGVAVDVTMSGRTYTAAALAQQAGTFTAADAPALTSMASEAPGIGPIGTPIGARSCASALGISADEPLLVDLGVADGGAPAALIVARTSRTAYLVQRSCTTGNPAIIAGPVTLS